MPSRDFTIFADYFQFYIQDEPADGDLSNAWSDEAVARLLAVAPGIVGIGTVRNMCKIGVVVGASLAIFCFILAFLAVAQLHISRGGQL